MWLSFAWLSNPHTDGFITADATYFDDCPAAVAAAIAATGRGRRVNQR